jgi:eukaryotic-like serine/threonine-protein kinase
VHAAQTTGLKRSFTLALESGTRVGPYEVIALLGQGGMGEVYRARDAKLNRDVAIKILPRPFVADAERLTRFEREARTLASLNHPHIGAIYGLENVDGTPALVLELVEGPTLADRLAKGPLPLREALTIAGQIADALEAAHERGIVHRDLKPANIKVTPAGIVKVLDFGLARPAAGGSGAAGADITQSPTVTIGGTHEGVILGTAAYMSPEQAQGQVADSRSDIWAFGVVLYEMLTGKQGFSGRTTVEVLSNVLKTDLDWTELPVSTPPAVRSLLQRCVQKERSRRLRDIADARFQIEEALNEPAGAASVRASAPARHTRERLLWLAGMFAVAAGAAGIARYAGGRQAQAQEVRLEINTPPTTDPISLAISPDGRQLIFVATSDGKSRLWLRPLDGGAARPLSGTENARFPFWSPDGRSVGFSANAQLKRVDIDSGAVRVLAAGGALGAAWNPDGTILFSLDPDSPLFRVSADGGEPVAVTQVNAQTANHRFPQFLPDRRHFFFYATGTAPGIYVGQLGPSDTPRRILDAQAATYASSGHVLFIRQGTLFAQAFDPVRLELAGSPTAVAEQVIVSQEPGVAALSASAAGPIVYRTGPPRTQSQFSWFDRSGNVLETVTGSDIGDGYNSSLSPDGRRLAMSRFTGATVGGTTDIWLLDLRRGVPSRFTSDPAFDLQPVWSPDGSRIAFNSNRRGQFDVYVKPAAGSGSDELLVGTEDTNDAPSDWSADGRFLLYARTPLKPGSHSHIWAVPLEGDRKPFPVVETTFDEGNGQFSPDSRWIAYQSNESGRDEIYVQPFPGAGHKTLISSGGGVQVRWRQNGQELFFLAPDNRLMAVPIRLDAERDSAEVGTPVSLFTTHVAGGFQYYGARSYMADRDGQRFLIDTLKEVTFPITVVLNWKPKP